jgi:integrase
VAGARLAELRDLDGEQPTWIIPGDTNIRGRIAEGRTKNRREQRVPLSPQAAMLFRRAKVLSSQREEGSSDYLFPADMAKVRKGKEAARTPHIHGESVSKAMRRMRETVGVADIGIHDMRRAISNWLKDQGVSREIRDLVLNHLDPSVTERHYSQEARMEKQVRDALQAWANHIWKVTGRAKPIDNVVQLAKRA